MFPHFQFFKDKINHWSSRLSWHSWEHGFLILGVSCYCCGMVNLKKKAFPTHPYTDGMTCFITVVERVVCLGHFFRLWTQGGTLQRPDGKICQANRAEILLLWVMTFCRSHAESMKGNPSTRTHPPPEPLFFSLVSFLLSFTPDKACEPQCT